MNVPSASRLPLGTAYDLPVEIRKIASLRSEVMSWTKLDPDLYGEIDAFYCMSTFKVFVVPCFWPHLLFLWPCLCSAKTAGVNAAKSQYWILTERELKIIQVDHDSTCIPGLMTSGNDIKTIPLENITDCAVDNAGRGCLDAEIASIHVDTANATPYGRCREATGIGLANHEEFIRKILNQRDLVKCSSGGGVMVPISTVATPVIASVLMDRTSAKVGGSTTTPPVTNQASSVADRIQVVKELYDRGILTHAEYEQRRQEIIATI